MSCSCTWTQIVQALRRFAQQLLLPMYSPSEPMTPSYSTFWKWQYFWQKRAVGVSSPRWPTIRWNLSTGDLVFSQPTCLWGWPPSRSQNGRPCQATYRRAVSGVGEAASLCLQNLRFDSDTNNGHKDKMNPQAAQRNSSRWARYERQCCTLLPGLGAFP